jgi:S1-C subfamily serine protease
MRRHADVMLSLPLVVGLGLLVAAGGGAPAGAQKLVPPSREVAQYSFAPIVRKAAPAVVNVYVRRRVQTFNSPFANDPFFRQFFGEEFGRPSERRSARASSSAPTAWS